MVVRLDLMFVSKVKAIGKISIKELNLIMRDYAKKGRIV
jgi:hypothetical protein